MTIYCTGCKKDVKAELSNGKEIYPHRPDLYTYPFWKCKSCGNYVGTHHKSNLPLRPLGVIPTPQLKEARMTIHKMLDPLWKSGKMRRKEVYNLISSQLGYQYHTAEIRSLEEAEKVLKIVTSL